MCVAVPGRVVAITGRTPSSIPAIVDVAGAEQIVDLITAPEAAVGDYVITHSGYAIRIVDAAEADRAGRMLGIAAR